MDVGVATADKDKSMVCCVAGLDPYKNHIKQQCQAKKMTVQLELYMDIRARKPSIKSYVRYIADLKPVGKNRIASSAVRYLRYTVCNHCGGVQVREQANLRAYFNWVASDLQYYSMPVTQPDVCLPMVAVGVIRGLAGVPISRSSTKYMQVSH